MVWDGENLCTDEVRRPVLRAKLEKLQDRPFVVRFDQDSVDTSLCFCRCFGNEVFALHRIAHRGAHRKDFICGFERYFFEGGVLL